MTDDKRKAAIESLLDDSPEALLRLVMDTVPDPHDKAAVSKAFFELLSEDQKRLMQEWWVNEELKQGQH
jgi:hypothetical protein